MQKSCWVKCNIMWKVKTNCKGEPVPAVTRRLSVCELDLNSPDSRSKFGYYCLEYVK